MSKRPLKFIFVLTSALFLIGCSKSLDSEYKYDHSYSICPIKVASGIDSFKQVDYKFSGYDINSYSGISVCFRRVGSNGNVKSYGEITDSRDNPNTWQTYHTYKKLGVDETGVLLRWIDLTEVSTGKTTRYVNY